MDKLRLMEDFDMKDKKDETVKQDKKQKDYKKFELLDELIKKENKDKRNA